MILRWILLLGFLGSSIFVECTPVNQYQEVTQDKLVPVISSLRNADNKDGTNLSPDEEDNKPLIHPIILVPGLLASKIEAKLDKQTNPHPYLCDKKCDWFTLWISPHEILPLWIDCFKENFMRIFNEKTGRTENYPGVETRVPGWGDTSTIEYVTDYHLSPIGYFSNIVDTLIKELSYERAQSLRGAPYDFRLSPYENEEYFVTLKDLVEETYLINKNQKVILICHSMGCLYSLYFLKLQSQDWKDKYIRSWITIAAPFGGATKALAAISAGESVKMIFNKKELRDLERSFSSVTFLLPVEEVFGDQPVFTYVKNGEVVELTAKDLPEMFKILNDTVGYRMWLQSKDLITDYSHPGVDVHCVVGKGSATTERILYNDDVSFPLKPVLVEGDGDGTVNMISASVCLKWSQASGNNAFSYQEFNGIRHVDMAKHKDVVRFVVNEVRLINEVDRKH